MAIFSQRSKIILETLCINWERHCANGELLQLQQRSVGNIKKRNMIEMRICVQTINDIIRINNSGSLK